MHAPEHLVRLNAAWEVLVPGDSSSRPFRVNLPVDWRGLSWPGGGPPPRLRLSRRFGRPIGLDPIAPAARARLLIDGAAAVRAVEIDGRPATWRREEPDRLVVDLPALGVRNVATIEIATAGAEGAWGSVSLVFGGGDAG